MFYGAMIIETLILCMQYASPDTISGPCELKNLAKILFCHQGPYLRFCRLTCMLDSAYTVTYKPELLIFSLHWCCLQQFYYGSKYIQYESKKVPFPFRSVFIPVSTVRFRSVPFTSVLTVYRGQTVLALGMNSSAKFTACIGVA